ncbi:MAG: hypothetical protein Rubg2KO_27220 [Rubricoccaceae bacterium]
MVVLLVFTYGVLVPTSHAQTTQALQLERGKNLISLSVRPTDPQMQTLFGDVLEDIVSVKDANGLHFAPGYSTDLTEWDWRQSYIVYANQALSLTVAGEPIEAGAEIPLHAGLNSVSYTQSTPMPAEEAFAKVAAVLEYVEDGAGRRYPATEGYGALHQLEPGQGYRVRLSADATLSYPSGPKSFDGDIDVNTMAEALALTGLQPGQTVGVAGYYRAGDGGGGLFEVRDSGLAGDGGLVFVPNEAVSDEVEETRGYSRTIALRGLPPSEDVVFGTLSMHAESFVRGVSISIPGHHLHGHRYQSRWTLRPTIFYEGGVFYDSHAGIHRYLGGGDAAAGQLTFRYRHTTSDRRLHRLGVGSTLDAHWFGARPAKDGPGWTGSTDVQPILAHMVNVAAGHNAAEAGSFNVVRLPATETYDYFGSIELADGLTLAGASGTEVVTVTNDLGHTYRPVRLRSAHTRLRVMDGEALLHIRMEKDPSDPSYIAPDIKYVLNTRRTAISPAHNVMSVGLADIVLDGNWEGNHDAWTEGWATNDELETHLRNQPGWAGFVATSHGRKQIPQGQVVEIRNAAVLGYGSNGLLGHANGTWIVENLRAGDAIWNHVLYAPNGTYTNLTLAGFAWGHAAWGYGSIENFVYEDGQTAPERQGVEVFSVRGADAYDYDDPSRMARYVRDDGTVPEDMSTTVEGFYMDLRGSGLTAAFNGIGPDITIRGVSEQEPGYIIMDAAGGVGAFFENGNGWQTGLYPRNRFEHIRIVDTSDQGRKWTMGRASLTEAVYNDIQTIRLGSSEAVSSASLDLNAGWRNYFAWDQPQEIEIESIVEEAPHQSIASVGVHENAAGITVRILDSSFNNTTSTLYRARSGRGALEAFTGDPSKIQVQMTASSFNMIGSYFDNYELFFAMTSFEECTDRRSGRTSEDAGQISITATGGERTVEIPTNLLWKPLDPSYIDVSASSSGLVQSVEAVHSNDKADDWRGPSLQVTLSRALAASEQVTFTWSAAVRPIPSN